MAFLLPFCLLQPSLSPSMFILLALDLTFSNHYLFPIFCIYPCSLCGKWSQCSCYWHLKTVVSGHRFCFTVVDLKSWKTREFIKLKDPMEGSRIGRNDGDRKNDIYFSTLCVTFQPIREEDHGETEMRTATFCHPCALNHYSSFTFCLYHTQMFHFLLCTPIIIILLFLSN